MGDFTIRAFDIPGGETEAFQRESIIRDSTRHSNLGVVSVVSFGFHEGLFQSEQALDADTADLHFLKERRQAELEMLDEWIPILCGTKGCAKWIITLATKADLWWQNGDNQPVLEYYRSGAYWRALEKWARHIPHSVHSFSSLDQRFYEEVPMTGHYDGPMRAHDRAMIERRLTEHLKAASL
jgi:hypothetical protein